MSRVAFVFVCVFAWVLVPAPAQSDASRSDLDSLFSVRGNWELLASSPGSVRDRDEAEDGTDGVNWMRSFDDVGRFGCYGEVMGQIEQGPFGATRQAQSVAAAVSQWQWRWAPYADYEGAVKPFVHCTKMRIDGRSWLNLVIGFGVQAAIADVLLHAECRLANSLGMVTPTLSVTNAKTATAVPVVNLAANLGAPQAGFSIGVQWVTNVGTGVYNVAALPVSVPALPPVQADWYDLVHTSMSTSGAYASTSGFGLRPSVFMQGDLRVSAGSRTKLYEQW